jgi:hypothetical protein
MEKDPAVARGAPTSYRTFDLAAPCGAARHIRSMIAAMPWPPPMHIVMRP